MPSYELPEHQCSHCGITNNAGTTSPMYDRDYIQPGDISICWNCGNPSIIMMSDADNDILVQRPLTAEELSDLESDRDYQASMFLFYLHLSHSQGGKFQGLEQRVAN